MSPATMLRKLIAVGGLILTIPIALLLVMSEITVVDAGIRAALLLVGVMAMRTVAGLFVGGPVVVAAAPVEATED